MATQTDSRCNGGAGAEQNLGSARHATYSTTHTHTHHMHFSLLSALLPFPAAAPLTHLFHFSSCILFSLSLSPLFFPTFCLLFCTEYERIELFIIERNTNTTRTETSATPHDGSHKPTTAETSQTATGRFLTTNVRATIGRLVPWWSAS